MKKLVFLLAVAALFAIGSVSRSSAEAPEKAKNKRLLLVTHSTGFVHGSVITAEEVLKDVGPKNGFDVTCWRFTGDPDAKDKSGKTALEAYSDKFRGPTKQAVGKEHCGRINKETLKNFDVVLFFTTGNPLTKGEIALIPQGIPRPYVAMLTRLGHGQKREFQFRTFRMSDATPFKREIAKVKSVRVMATDVSGKTYQREVPFK